MVTFANADQSGKNPSHHGLIYSAKWTDRLQRRINNKLLKSISEIGTGVLIVPPLFSASLQIRVILLSYWDML